MPTADSRINIYEKRLFSKTGMDDQFYAYLQATIDEVTAAIFQGTSGVLDSDEIELVAGATNDKFSLDLTNASKVVVGGGQIIDLSQITGTGITTDITFEDDGSSVYHVGIKYQEVPVGIEFNPRTNDPEYPAYKQTYGEQDNPTSVTDNTTYIRVNINSITESGVDHSGRTVRVWLVDPVSGVESVAYFEGTSAYSAPNNYVDIPYSGAAGPLGQDTGAEPPSTTATDYVVFIEGATWRDADISSDANYAYIGTVTSTGGAPSFSVANQNPIFINTLDRAYDGAVGSGSGRLIYVDAEAVEIRSRGGGTDELYSAFRIDRKGGTEDAGCCAQFIADQSDGKENCTMHFVPLVHSTSNLIVDNPCDTVATDKVTRTGSVDWTTSGLHVLADFAWLQGFATSDGLYRITNITATQLTLALLDGGTINLTGSESGNVTILRCVQATGVPLWGDVLNPASGRGPNTFSGLNEDTATPALAAAFFYGYESDCAKFYDTEATSPVAKTRITNEGLIDTGGCLVRPEPFSAVGSNPQDRRILGIVMPTGDGDPLDAQPSARCAGVWNHRGDEIERLEYIGRRAETIRFKDDFMYNSATWGSAFTVAPYYTFGGSGASPSFTVGNITLPGGYGRIATDSGTPAIGQTAALDGEDILSVSTTDLGAVCFYAKCLLPSATIMGYDPIFRIGFKDSGGGWALWWEADMSDATPYWELHTDNGSGSTTQEVSSVVCVADGVLQLYMIADPYASTPSVNGYVRVNSNDDLMTGIAFPTAAGRWLNVWHLTMEVETGAANTSYWDIDFWEGWMDGNLRAGPEA